MPLDAGPGDGPPTRSAVTAIAGLAGLLLVIIGGILIGGPAHGAPLAPDAGWARLMTSSRSAPGIAVAMALAVIGGTVVTSVGAALVAVVLFVRRRRRTAISLVATVIVASIASPIIKSAVQRPRPTGGLMHLTSFSYPSGHATIAATLAVVLVLALPRVWTWILGSAWAAVIAWSRTYLGVHWLSDVAAGVVLGASLALLVHSSFALVTASRAVSGGRRTASGEARRSA